MENNLILSIYKKPQTVFTLKELSLGQPAVSYQNLRRRMHYLVKTNKLKRLRPGLYAKEPYNILEAANKLYAPSYIGFETVLQKEGIIFQHYTTIFAASYLSRKVKVADHDFFYRKIKNLILLNRDGIEEKNGYFIASKERAFLDAIFLYKDYHFDNLRPLDWDKINRLKSIYESKILDKRIDQYHQIYKNDHV